MALSPGTRLGPYEIVAPIGAGGMGEVYRAKDTRLARDVALKVLPESFAQDADRLSRFSREARLLASLNHPNIAGIYGFEESDGVHCLVMEFIEGTPLKGPLPFKEAIACARQILDALDAAHRKGITHRDLKPANILTTARGIKLLDFGLAKRNTPLNETDSTVTEVTAVGQISGTLGFISPEQLQGKEADARSDLFSFGCVLYQILTGNRAFEGQSAAAVIAAILGREPEPLDTSPPLQRIIRRCLAKDPDHRFQNALDLKTALDWALEEPAAIAADRRGRRAPWVVAGACAAIAAVAFTGWMRAGPRAQPPLQPMVRLDVDLGLDASLKAVGGAGAILSPDGSRLVYCSQSRLFTRRLDQAEPAALPGTEEATTPFFSPDGKWVAFFAAGKLKKTPVEGGAVTTLCDSNLPGGGSWGEDGNIVVARGNFILSRIPSAGGDPVRVTALMPGEGAHRWPQILPGGKHVLFTMFPQTRGLEGARLEVMTLADGSRKQILQRAIYGRYLPSGHLVYVNDGTLFAAPFDLNRLEVRGTPAPVLGDLGYNPTFGSAQIDFSRLGTVVYRSRTGWSTVQWLDRSGNTQPLVSKPGAYGAFRLSPDGHRLAIAVAGDIWVYDSRGDTMTRLTTGGGYDVPVWSPDGRYVVFMAPDGMSWNRADGARKLQTLSQSNSMQIPWSFAADGKRLSFSEFNSTRAIQSIWTLPIEIDDSGLTGGKPEPLLQSPFSEGQPTLSPDGRWLAYTSDESGIGEVYVRALAGNGGKWPISNTGGSLPIWSRNRRELLFRRGSQIMVAEYTVKDNSFVADKSRFWSGKSLARSGANAEFDVAPDGERIAVLWPAEGAEEQKAQNHVIFMLNFLDELKRRVPPEK